MSWIKLSPCDCYWLSMAVNCTTTLSGVFNCVVYELTNGTYRKRYTTKEIVLYLIISPFLIIPFLIRRLLLPNRLSVCMFIV